LKLSTNVFQEQQILPSFSEEQCAWERKSQSDAPTVYETNSWHIPTNPPVTDHSKLNLVNTILSCICTRFKTFVVVSDVCKASRLICGKMHKVVTKISFGVFSHKEIFTPQKIHVPSSIKQKIKPKIQNFK
jgi:hypothetical protein